MLRELVNCICLCFFTTVLLFYNVMTVVHGTQLWRRYTNIRTLFQKEIEEKQIHSYNYFSTNNKNR